MSTETTKTTAAPQTTTSPGAEAAAAAAAATTTTAAAAAAAAGDHVLLPTGEDLSVQVAEQERNWRDLVPDVREHTADVTDTTGQFEDYMLKREVLRGIYAIKWERPSPVQASTIPLAVSGYDIIARAKNGVGKTGSYLIPILERVDVTQQHTQAMVLVPTIELAAQTYDVCKTLGKYIKGLNVLLLRGGTSVSDDIARLRATAYHIVVATPGRARDLILRSTLRLDKLQIAVLDEADKLLSGDFQPDVEAIFSAMPREKQVLLFSATYPQRLKVFCDAYQRNARPVNTMTELCLKGLTHYYAYVEERSKVYCLNTLFRHLTIYQSITFCNSVERVQALSKKIADLGHSCAYIHARMSSEDRTKVLHDFRHKVFRHLVASDLCSRGIDVPDVNVVFNFDFPTKSDAYLHRVGRSGRFGRLGLAINLITEADSSRLSVISRELALTIKAIPNKVDPSLYTK